MILLQAFWHHKRIFLCMIVMGMVFTFLSCKKETIVAGVPGASVPVLTTDTATSIARNSFVTGGNILSDGGTAITQRGIVWSIAAAPTVFSNKVMSGNMTGPFATTLINLAPGTVYYVRAYAINATDTAYGNQIIVQTLFPDVYIAGVRRQALNNRTACFWKNGLGTFLFYSTYSSRASSIFIKEDDIYIGGYTNTGSKYTATIWKNGSPTFLGDFTSNSYVNDVIVVGNDVYAVGSAEYVSPQGFTLTEGRVWKNGVRVDYAPFHTATSVYYAITASGTDIYVSGYSFSNLNQFATLWKNGVPSYVSNIHGTIANAVFAKGNDVYVAINETVGAQRVPRLWINGTATILPTPGDFGYANSIVVANDDVYVAGSSLRYTGTANYSIATVWKNGMRSVLESLGPVENTTANDIQVTGNMVFVCGTETATGGRVWWNGLVIDGSLTSFNSFSEANGIFLK